MNLDILLTLGIAAGALVLFVSNKLRIDVVGMLVMATVILTRLVTLEEGLSGFANEALLTVAAMFVLSAGLVRTGAIDILGKWIARLAGRSERRLLTVSLLLVVPLSAFINNTPVVAVMAPVLLGIARRIAARPSKLLMPLSFATQLGGTLTLIGTSTNLLAAGLALELGVGRLGLFDITGPAFVLMVVGLIYMLTLGYWLTPVRQGAEDPIAAYELREYVSVLGVEADSPLSGKTLGATRFASEYGLQVLAIERRDERIEAPHAGTLVHSGDALVVRGKVTHLARIAESVHIRISTPAAQGEAHRAAEAGDGRPGPERKLAELMVPPHSRVVGRTLRQLDFREHYGVPVLGIQRHGVNIVERMGDVELEAGDLVLVRGTTDELRRIHHGRDLALLGPLALPARRVHKMRLSMVIVAAVVLLAAFDVVPIVVSAMLGTIAMFLTGCLTPEEAYEEVDWMVLVLLGSLIPLGIAMQHSGAAVLIADSMLSVTAPVGPLGALCALYLLTAVLTELISNNATALLLTPIAVATAAQLDVSPLPFVIAVMLAASNAFSTPIGYQTNTFVYGPGGYRFSDFLRVGGPLNVLMIITATIVIPWFFPF